MWLHPFYRKIEFPLDNELQAISNPRHQSSLRCQPVQHFSRTHIHSTESFPFRCGNRFLGDGLLYRGWRFPDSFNAISNSNDRLNSWAIKVLENHKREFYTSILTLVRLAHVSVGKGIPVEGEIACVYPLPS